MHIYFCAVGQGDAVYIRFPDGKDALLDAGPKAHVVGCLSRYMPFWDRALDLAILTHPEADHMEGFIPVLERYTVATFLRSNVAADTPLYRAFVQLLKQKNIPVRYVQTGDRIRVGSVLFSVVWPTASQLALGIPASGNPDSNTRVLGVTTGFNDFSLAMWLRFGTFDVFFPGDGDARVQSGYENQMVLPDRIEIFKVPHHGSRTAFTQRLLEVLQPVISVISVGKNSYGHPAPEVLTRLSSLPTVVERTDVSGDIEIVTDGNGWKLLRHSRTP